MGGARFRSLSTGRSIRAVLFDTFGTVVDWRTGIASAVAGYAERHQRELDAAAFADRWRDRYQPSMEPIRSGAREFVTLDTLHRENLDAALLESGIAPQITTPESWTSSRVPGANSRRGPTACPVSPQSGPATSSVRSRTATPLCCSTWPRMPESRGMSSSAPI